MNLKRILIRNEIFIDRDLSILNSRLKLNPDSCKLPLSKKTDACHIQIGQEHIGWNYTVPICI